MYTSTIIPTIKTESDSLGSYIDRMDQMLITLNQYDHMPNKKESLKLAEALAPSFFRLFKEDIAFGCHCFLNLARYYDAKTYIGQTLLLILQKMSYEEHNIDTIYTLAELYRVQYATLKSETVYVGSKVYILNSLDAYYQYGASLGCKRCKERIYETEAYNRARSTLSRTCSNTRLQVKKDIEQLRIMEDIVVEKNRVDFLSDYILWLQVHGYYSRIVAICDDFLSDPDFEDTNDFLKEKRKKYRKEVWLEYIQRYVEKFFHILSIALPLLFVLFHFQAISLKVSLSMGFVIYLFFSYLAPAPLAPLKSLFSILFGGTTHSTTNDTDLWDCLLIYSLLR